MAYFFGDSFDLYAVPADATNGYWDAGATNFVLGNGRFTGSRCFVTGNTSNTVFLVKTSGVNDAIHHIVCGFSTTSAVGGTNNGLSFTLSDGATAQCTVTFKIDGTIVLCSGAVNGTVLATYSGAWTAANTWYAFEIEVNISNTGGYMNVRKNGNTSNDFASATNLNTRASANNYANKLSIVNGTTGSAFVCSMDDFLWRSDASAVPWIGDVRCWTRMPATDASVAWTRPGTFQMQPYTGTTGNGSNTINNSKYVSFISQGGSIGSVIINMIVGYTGNMKCAIYASASGQPGAVVQSATAPINNPVTGANTFTFSPAVSIARGTQFFVAICTDVNTGTAFTIAASAPYNTAGFTTATTTYSTWPVNNPTSLGAIGAFPFFPVVTPGANADLVSELQQDAATSYVYSSTVSQSDLYGIAAIGSTPSTIVGVTTRCYAQKSDAGTRNIAVQLQSGAANVQSASSALNTTWAWVSRTDLVDPATGSAWTATAINNVQIGAVVTA